MNLFKELYETKMRWDDVNYQFLKDVFKQKTDGGRPEIVTRSTWAFSEDVFEIILKVLKIHPLYKQIDKEKMTLFGVPVLVVSNRTNYLDFMIEEK